jgi:cytochrome c oxidase subunit 3
MHIPYTTEIRPDTGVNNPTLGMWLFLASEAMLFGSLFSSYALLRWGAASWPEQSAVLNVPLAALNTVVLLLSSATIVAASKAAQSGHISRARRFLTLTFAAGAIFLVIKGVEYADKLAQGLVPATNNFLGLYYAMTGLHALHLVAGLAVVAYLLGPGARMWQDERARFTTRLEVAGIYWHFVDGVWLLLFVVFYLS